MSRLDLLRGRGVAVRHVLRRRSAAGAHPGTLLVPLQRAGQSAVPTAGTRKPLGLQQHAPTVSPLPEETAQTSDLRRARHSRFNENAQPPLREGILVVAGSAMPCRVNAHSTSPRQLNAAPSAHTAPQPATA